jgi:hypothetical protein
MIDWNQAEQWGVDAFFAGVCFIVPVYIGLRILALSVLTHPTVMKLASAAVKLSGKGGDFWSSLIGIGRDLLGGSRPPNQ